VEPSDARAHAADLLARVLETGMSSADDGFPVYADPETGAWSTTEDGSWNGGFWVAALGELVASGHLERPELLRWLERLHPRVSADTSLRGLLFWYGAAHDFPRTTGDEGRNLALAATRALTESRHRPSGLIPLGNAFGASPDPTKVVVNIDGLAGTAALCGWAANATRNKSIGQIAAANTRRLAELLIRKDGSTWQAAELDATTGRLLRRCTQKGASDESTWARGQAWAMLGFVQAAVWLGEEFLPLALATARWWCAHTDHEPVNPWDFSDPDGLRDTSAAAIAARGLLALGHLEGEGSPFTAHAHSTIDDLVGGHLGPNNTTGARGRLLDGCLNYPERSATCHELIWGSWFLLESLLVIGNPDRDWRP